MSKCLYCNNEILDGRKIEVCDECGSKVWGEETFKAIRKNMEKE